MPNYRNIIVKNLIVANNHAARISWNQNYEIDKYVSKSRNQKSFEMV